MALMVVRTCERCYTKFSACQADITIRPFGKMILCVACIVEAEDERKKAGIKTEEEVAREEYFAKLDKLSMEERVRKIEEWIYNFKMPNSCTHGMVY